MSVLYLTHPACLLHDMGAHHPERPQRLEAIEQALAGAGLFERLERVEAPQASREDLERAHDAAYVEDIFARSPASGLTHIDMDTAMNPHSLEAALRAAGAVVHAVDRVITGRTRRAFCAVRPPGHHAEHARSMGFCFFNNVAVGAARALAVHDMTRVAIVDFDVHHGNGTEDIFCTEPRVRLYSSAQHPFYPFHQVPSPCAQVLSLPLEAGADGEVFRNLIEARCLPALDDFEPELLMISAGFDAHADDPLAAVRLHESDFAWITQRLSALADKHAGGRIVSTLEGGYALGALGRSVVAHVEALLDGASPQA